MAYYWKNGSRIGVHADIAGEELERIRQDGRVTPQAVVDAARPDHAPLHPAFEWDDEVAGENWRRHEARMMLNSIRVVTDEDAEPQRVYFNVKLEDENVYVTSALVMTDEDIQHLLMEDAVHALIAARQRYAEVKALSTVWEAIDQIALEIEAA